MSSAFSATIFGGGELRQYAVYDNPSKQSQAFAPYVVVLQSHLLDGLPSAVAAPLLHAARAERFAYLSVDVNFDGGDYVLSLHELATFDARQFRRQLGDLTAHQDAIERGLHRLFNGF